MPDFTFIRWSAALSWSILHRAVSFFRTSLKIIGIGIFSALILFILGNAWFGSERDRPSRSLSTAANECSEGGGPGWDVLGRPRDSEHVAIENDEWKAIDAYGPIWRRKLACVWQRHVVPGYSKANGEPLSYDFAFIEFTEDGKTFATRELCGDSAEGCVDEGYGLVRKRATSQLYDVLKRLATPDPQYVLVFVHGWRHDASLGDSNVGDVRHYAAHVARFLADRALDNPGSVVPRVTAIYIGWPGARTDETWLRRLTTRWFGSTAGEALGSFVGTFLAAPTLFDRKPVSEAVAPSVLSALRRIEQALGIPVPLADPKNPPSRQKNHMIVFGHSLGGNMLATALKDDLIKKVLRHQPRTYMLPTLGDLVVLINPAAEAEKWVAVQRAVWQRLPMSVGERLPTEDYRASHLVFRKEQRPIIVSVTAARDWPPGGRSELDCQQLLTGDNPDAAEKLRQSRRNSLNADYDWATYDLFPAFKVDFRPLADRMTRFSTGLDPHDLCLSNNGYRLRSIILKPVSLLAEMIRHLPFIQTDPEETRTIGHLDPQRAVRAYNSDSFFSARPFGTTHELRGRSMVEIKRKPKVKEAASSSETEIPIDYSEISSEYAACPSATNWLEQARQAQKNKVDSSGKRLYPNGTYWNSGDAGPMSPALVFQHGFFDAKLSPITRANDPFWNIRAFDSALARHDGYMLSSFICAMNQLVMDEITTFSPIQEGVMPAAPDPETVKTSP